MKSITRLYNERHYKVSSGESNMRETTNENKPDENGSKQRLVNKRPTPRRANSKQVAEEQLRMIVHEIRNPLTAISLANQSLRQQIDTDEGKAINEIIFKNVNRIESLLKQVLQITAKQNLNIAEADIGDIIETTVARADDRIFLKKIDVIVSFSPGLKIVCDREKLSLALLNLIINSIEAVREDEGKIWITAYRVKGEIKLVVKDNGDGMEPEVTRQIFDKNFSGKTHGLGVGLSHVKEILLWHDATISVNSEPGTGTSIVLVFRAK